MLDRSGQVVRLPDLDAVGAVGRGDARVIDVRAGVAHPVLGVAEDHLLPQDLAERVVVVDHDLDRQLVLDRGDEFGH